MLNFYAEKKATHNPAAGYDRQRNDGEAPMGQYPSDSRLPPYSPSPDNDREHMMKYADEFISEYYFVYLLNKFVYML